MLTRDEDMFAKEEEQEGVWGTLFGWACDMERTSATEGSMRETGITSPTMHWAHG